MREIDEDWRERRGGGEHLERIVPRPSAMRDGLKGEIRERYRREVPPGLRERAEALYEAFAPPAPTAAPVTSSVFGVQAGRARLAGAAAAGARAHARRTNARIASSPRTPRSC
jgi:hypothetical protein